MRWKEVISESVSGLNDIPDITGMDIMDTMPVAEYQKRTRYADSPLRVWVYKQRGKWCVVKGDEEFTFKNLEKLGAWLDSNGYLDYVGNTTVNV